MSFRASVATRNLNKKRDRCLPKVEMTLPMVRIYREEPITGDAFICAGAWVIIACLVIILIWSGQVQAYTGRKATLFTEASVMLKVNEPYRRGSTDCSGMMWRLLKKTFPELGIQKWFKRTTADVMAGWAWQPVMRLSDAIFGDLLFCGQPHIDHVMMGWVDAWNDAIHAAKSRGFSRTRVSPYWTPKISVVVRPPY